MLKPGHYHAVVANPPYITPKDQALNDAYRERTRPATGSIRSRCRSCSGFSDWLGYQHGGFTGQITANSFMKREFGKKLIEEYLGRDQLT